MRLGFAVKVLGQEGLKSHDARRHQNAPHLKNSIAFAHGIFDYLHTTRISMEFLRRGVASVELDGKAVRTAEIPLKDDGGAHRIVVTLGEKTSKASGNGIAALPEAERVSAEMMQDEGA